MERARLELVNLIKINEGDNFRDEVIAFLFGSHKRIIIGHTIK